MNDQRQVSVDFGATSVRGVEQTVDKKGRRTIQSVAEIPLPYGTVYKGRIANDAALTAALKELWAAGGFKTKEVIFGISNDAVIVRGQATEWHDSKHFRQMLRFKIGDGFLHEDRDYEIDAHIQQVYDQTAPDGQVKRMCHALVVAAEQDMVIKFVECLAAAGLKPRQADLIGMAIARAATDSVGTIVSVDIGAHGTELVIHHNGQPVLLRRVADTNVERIDDALIATEGWTRAEAIRTKHSLGVSSPVAPGHGIPPDPGPAQPLIDHFASDLINQIRSSLDYFLSKTQAIESIDRVILSGGGSQIRGLADRLRYELRIPVEVGNPFDGVTMKCQPPAQPASWAVAMGLGAGVAA